MKLSIGRAWDEAKQIMRADGGPIIAIALALVVLPGAILETAAPSTLRTGPMPLWLSVAGLATALLSLAAQIAISRIALGPPITVGGALGHAFRRLPVLFAGLLLVVLPFVLILFAIALANGGELQPNAIPPALAIPVSLMMLVALFIFLRLLFITPLAASTSLGPVALVKQAWSLSRGNVIKLLLLLLALALIALVLVVGLGGALSAVIILLLGSIAPGNVSAVLVALVQQALAVTVSVLFVLVVSRLYAQATGRGVSVPHAGGD